MVCLEMIRDHSVIFEIASKYYIKQNSAYQISLKDTTWDKVESFAACGWMLPQSGREEKGDEEVTPFVHKKTWDHE